MTFDAIPDAGDTPREKALSKLVGELERHVARDGWEQPIRLFALVRTGTVIKVDPAAAARLPEDAVKAAEADPEHMLSIEQDKVPATHDLESLIGALSWPDVVDGAAIAVERIVLPPEAQEDMPTDEAEALTYLMEHPERQDVRLAAGVLRTGEKWTAVRTRGNDDDLLVLSGPDLADGLVAALAATFED